MIDVGRWPGLTLVQRVSEGNRNQVWRGDLQGMSVAVRRSGRSPASLRWELDLIEQLESLDFRVPTVCPAGDGSRHVDGVVVQHWLEGGPPESDTDWHRVAAELLRLHRLTAGHCQRPECCSVVELVDRRRSLDADLDSMPADVSATIVGTFAQFATAPTSVIHGDPGPSNIRMGTDGRVGLLDWDESRVDLQWHDLSNLGISVLDDRDQRAAEQLSHAWEAACGWTTEPAYARRRFALLETV